VELTTLRAPNLSVSLGLLIFLGHATLFPQTWHQAQRHGIAALVSGSSAAIDTNRAPVSDIEIEIRLGEIYRESGTNRNHEISQSRYLATIKLPMPIVGAYGLLRYSRWQTELVYKPNLAQTSNLTWMSDQLVLEAGGVNTSAHVAYDGTLGVSRLTGQNRLIGGLELELRLKPYFAAIVAGGREVSAVQLGNSFSVKNYPLNAEISETWYRIGGRFKLARELFVTGQIKYGNSEYISSEDERDYRAAPAIRTRRDQISVVYRPSRKSTAGIVYATIASSGRSPIQYNGTGAGLLTTLNLQEDLIQIYGRRRDRSGRLWQLDYSRLSSRYETRGHLEPWPIAESIIVQVAILYFNGTGTWASDRLRLAVEGAGNSWALAANYIWIGPDMDGSWQQRNLFVFFGEKHAYDLSIKRAELLVLEGSKAFTIGKRFRLVYSLRQALPVKVVRKPGLAPPPASERNIRTRGGTFHMIKLEVNVR
jgi:hypothetical protein